MLKGDAGKIIIVVVEGEVGRPTEAMLDAGDSPIIDMDLWIWIWG
jgi:hypothetical protein